MAPASRHTVVKICGITRAEDARSALAFGADWLGFILNSKSPRRIDAGRAREIGDEAEAAVTVGVMVAPDPDEALALAAKAGVDRIQLHRVKALEWPADFPLPISFAVPVELDGSLTEPLPQAHHLVLLDRAHRELSGGTGETFSWETARIVAAARPVLLAGGLDSDNVGTAIERVRPFGVDVCSRIEVAPGIKDHDRLRRFLAAVRQCDERLDAAG